jgi:hypothetical protein
MKRAVLLTVLMAFGGWSGCKANGEGIATAARPEGGGGGVMDSAQGGGGTGGGSLGSAGTSGPGSVSNQTNASGGDAGAPGGAGGSLGIDGGNSAVGSGGVASTSGVPAGAGAPGGGGAPGSAGAVAPGGTPASAGATASAGVPASGGAAASAGAPTSGGATASGGVPGSGGATASGGTATPRLDGGLAGNTGQGNAGTSGSDAAVVLADAQRGGISGTGGDSGSGGASGSSGDTGLGQDDGSRSDDRPDIDAGSDSRDGSARRLLWSDEFDLGTYATADPTKWNIITWDPDTVNGEKQKYTARRQNVFHDGQGHLVLRGLHDSWAGNGDVYPYTSGRVQTDGLFEFKFGRIEVRAKLPAGQGSFPAMLLMGTSGSWPRCGEIGLMEQWGQDKSWLYCSTYAGGVSGDIGNIKVSLPEATNVSSDFHVYALDWYADHMVFFIDDVEVARSDFDSTSPFYTNTFYLIFDVAIGGEMGGTIDDANGFPMDMVLDYVRVYAP